MKPVSLSSTEKAWFCRNGVQKSCNYISIGGRRGKGKLDCLEWPFQDGENTAGQTEQKASGSTKLRERLDFAYFKFCPAWIPLIPYRHLISTNFLLGEQNSFCILFKTTSASMKANVDLSKHWYILPSCWKNHHIDTNCSSRTRKIFFFFYHFQKYSACSRSIR